MRYLNYFVIIGLLTVLVPLAGCSAGTRAFNRGEEYEAKGMYEEAMYSYADAFRHNPDEGIYRARFLRSREQAANARYKRGEELYKSGNYVDAAAEFQAAQALDPSQARFKQMVEDSTRLKDAQLVYQEGADFEKNNKLKNAYQCYRRALELSPNSKEYQDALARVSGARKGGHEGYELNIRSAKPITIKFRDAKLKDVFNIITQLSGIYFVFDDAVKDQPVTIFLENATFQQTLDLLTNLYKLERKVLNESTVLIYPFTPDKVKQYEDMVLRTIHLSFMDAKKAVNLIRTMLQVRKIYVNEESNSVVVRDTANVVAVVEKILDANDVPDAEVVLDVEVLEINDRNTTSLGLLLSNYNVQMGAFSPSGNLLSSNSLLSTTTTLTSGSTVTTQNNVGIDNLLRIFKVRGYGGYITVPSATYNLSKALAKGEVLSNPKIRVKNKEKSKFTVGTRVPITTTSTTGTTGGFSVNVQYVDVGVKVNAEPTIQLNNEVSIKVGLEVSSIAGQQTVGGPDSPTVVVTINTKNLDTVLSLKDGETSVIGGLISKNQTSSKQKVFLLSDIPLLGPLLTQNDDDSQKSEVVLAITPHIVRHVTVPPQDITAFVSGKEDDPSLTRPLASFEQEPQFESAPPGGVKQPAVAVPPPAGQHPVPPAPAPAPAQKPMMGGTPSPPVPFPVPGTPAPTPPTQPVPAPSKPPGAATATDTRAAVVPATPPGRALLQLSAPAAISVGQQFGLDARVSDLSDLARLTATVTYDPTLVEFVSASEGSFLNRDAKPTQFSSRVDVGGVTVSLARSAGAGGVSGNGTLFSLLFRAKKQGSAGFGFNNVNFSAPDGRPLAVLPFSTAVPIR